MALRKSIIVAGNILTGALLTFGQTITFNSPTPWLTQRNDSITVRAQIDTAQVKKKSISLSAFIVSEGKKKSVASKSFKVIDYSGEFALGSIKKDLLGGKEYVQVDWSIPGTQEKGTIAPIGIVNLDKLPSTPPINVVHVKDGIQSDAVVAEVKEFCNIGSMSFGCAWNKDAFFIVTNASRDSSVLKFILDGKSGKNAFLSYPDRVIAYSPLKDSAWGVHYARDIIGDSLVYTEKSWTTEIAKSKVGDKIIIKMPWFDTGILPFEDRTIGFGVFLTAVDGSVISSTSKTAQFYIPGTWGDIKLLK